MRCLRDKPQTTQSTRISSTAHFTLSFLGWSRPDERRNLTMKYVDANDMSRRSCLSGRMNICPVLQPLTGCQSSWYEAGVWVYIKQSQAVHLLSVSHAPPLKLQDHLQQFYHHIAIWWDCSWGKKKQNTTRPFPIFLPFLALTSCGLILCSMSTHQGDLSHCHVPRKHTWHLAPGCPIQPSLSFARLQRQGHLSWV